MTETVPHLDRCQGVMLGLAVGDALGAPLEFQSAEEIVRAYGAPVRNMLGGGFLGWDLGEWTDDTAMAVCIAESILSQGRFDPADVAERFLRWFQSGPRDVGNTISVAMHALASGERWDRAGRWAHDHLGGRTAGNGAIMRCAPIALLGYRAPDRLIEDSVNSALITHWDARARYGAAGLNLAIAALIQEASPEVALRQAATGVQAFCPEVAALFETAGAGERADLCPSGFSNDTLRLALWCFVRTNSFEEALIAAVNLGGDADTGGVVCGALAGAHYGLAAIPQRWLTPLHERERLMRLAVQVARLAGK
ncbi:MAG TPA: ADP-ribosylglycohydrolase family protein [Ktedonobacterales bacterium]|nr:ADP-ribosylglycohydrolase family protein [Ktedonobacterales bacterium]